MTPDCAGGVHWLTVGKMTNRQGELDTAKLFNKVHTLILRLDGQREPRPLPTLEAAHDYLQKVCVCDYRPWFACLRSISVQRN